jgi:hypothetical protein
VSAQTSDAWQFGAQLYGFFPSLDARTNFPASSGGVPVEVDASKLLSDLKFVFMGSFEARKGRWGGFTDLMYFDVGSNHSGTRDLVIGGIEIPATASASVNYDIKGLAWTIAGEYALIAQPQATTDLVFGARMIKLEQAIDWGLDGNIGGIPSAGRTGSSFVERTNWDGIVGAKGRWYFTGDRHWFAPWYVDIGTGDSDLTWQAMGGIGYSWGTIDTVLAYRHLDYDFGSGKPFLEFSLSGPQLSVAFRW